MRFLLLTGHGHVHGVPPRSEWEPEALRAYAAHQRDLAAELRRRGELVETQRISDPAGARVVMSDGVNPPVVSDDTLGEPAVADYWVIEVTSEDRALEIAGRVSAAPGPDGRAIQERVEVRAVVGSVI